MTSIGLSPSKASFGVCIHLPIASLLMTSESPLINRRISTNLRATTSVGGFPLSKVARDLTDTGRSRANTVWFSCSRFRKSDTLLRLTDGSAALAFGLRLAVTVLLVVVFLRSTIGMIHPTSFRMHSQRRLASSIIIGTTPSAIKHICMQICMQLSRQASGIQDPKFTTHIHSCRKYQQIVAFWIGGGRHD